MGEGERPVADLEKEMRTGISAWGKGTSGQRRKSAAKSLECQRRGESFLAQPEGFSKKRLKEFQVQTCTNTRTLFPDKLPLS